MHGEDLADKECLTCPTILFRGILRRTVVDWQNKRVLPSAFHLRPLPKDEDGLSVGHSCDVSDYLNQFRQQFGAASLHTGRVRDMGLSVKQDDIPNHAVINLPHLEEDPVQAELLALELANHARLLQVTNSN